MFFLKMPFIKYKDTVIEDYFASFYSIILFQSGNDNKRKFESCDFISLLVYNLFIYSLIFQQGGSVGIESSIFFLICIVYLNF